MAVIVGTPAEVHGPKIPTPNLESAMTLLDFEVRPLLMFLDVGMLTSKQLVHDRSGTLCLLRRQLLASNVLRMHNETHVHNSTGRPRRLD